MDTTDAAAIPFKVLDEEGEVDVEKVVFLPEGKVALSLGRTIQGAAKVHGAYGTDPAVVPMDFERLMPMLGFYGVEVDED